MKFKEYINETHFDTFTQNRAGDSGDSGDSDVCEVFENPTPSEVQEILKQREKGWEQDLRGFLLKNGTVYMWAASQANHVDVLKKVPALKKVKGTSCIPFEAYKRGKVVSVSDWDLGKLSSYNKKNKEDNMKMYIKLTQSKGLKKALGEYKVEKPIGIIEMTNKAFDELFTRLNK